MPIKEIIENIKQMKARNAFRNYIDYIKFPYFRNLERNTQINFEFPLTVFVGQNGSGKSSTLHALFGAPKYKTPYEFWFSTVVDPIAEVSEGGDRHCFFYTYKDQEGNELEVLKLRIHKRGNPDYWETSRPVRAYGMRRIADGLRNQPVEKDVVYLDFRSELSAFDKYFYFRTPRKTLTISTKQDYLRKYSVFLKRIIDGNEPIVMRYGKAQNEALRALTAQELEAISFILGKNYVSGSLIKHKLFEEWGYSVLFETNTYSYSEAFAGSGEMAVVRLVLEILAAATNSLILLDEPEVSLHPGAQKRLKQFLLEQTRTKRFQIVISTHSPSLIEDLPSEAIKVFSQVPTGKFIVKNGITPDEAFFHLEQTNPAKKTIIVEDYLAKEIIYSVLNTMGADTASLFDITFYPGGASVLKKNFILVYSSETRWNKYVIFDGDQKRVESHFDPDQLIEADQTSERFRTEIQSQTGIDIVLFPDGNSLQGGSNTQKKALRKNYLKYYLNNVNYLPLEKPEDIIWNIDLAAGILTPLQKFEEIESLRVEGLSSKEKFKLLSVAMTTDTSAINSLEKTFLGHWLNSRNADYDDIVNILTRIRNL